MPVSTSLIVIYVPPVRPDITTKYWSGMWSNLELYCTKGAWSDQWISVNLSGSNKTSCVLKFLVQLSFFPYQVQALFRLADLQKIDRSVKLLRVKCLSIYECEQYLYKVLYLLLYIYLKSCYHVHLFYIWSLISTLSCSIYNQANTESLY